MICLDLQPPKLRVKNKGIIENTEQEINAKNQKQIIKGGHSSLEHRRGIEDYHERMRLERELSHFEDF